MQYELVQVPLQQVEHPTIKQYFMAVIPTLFIFLASSTILIYNYEAKGTKSLEASAPSLATILSVMMMLFEIIIIAYKNHERFEILRSLMDIILRINLVHLIISASFIPYQKTTGDYSTYFTWSCVCTVPIILLSGFPFFMEMFVLDYS
jgi:cytochrome bd-type quinol oxidase subunit 2